ncbi:MAG: hypothetical protein P1U69_03205 [Parvibaculaceae bacterium]|nr:hypothetical protein [Parvibaculaceae bacterium]
MADLSLRKIDTETAAQHLSRESLCGPKGKPRECDPGFFTEEVKAGRMAAVGFFLAGDHIASVALGACEGQTGKELEINALSGDVEDVELISEGLGLLEEWAKTKGFAQMRFHTFRRGLMAISDKRGWYPSEIVMKKVFT